MKPFSELLLALSLLLGAACSGPKTVLLERVDEMQYGDSTRTGVPFSKDPTVIRLGDRYLMYYSVCDFSPDRAPAQPAPDQAGWSSAIAESRDLVHWTRVGDLVLRDSHGERIWGCVAPCVKVFDGVIHLFYQRRWTPAHGNNNLWHATSEDGITFINTHDEPVFIPETSWSIDRSIDAEVFRVGDRMILMYATRDPSQTWQMLGMAEAPYGCDYGPDKWTNLSVDGPFLKPDFPWEQHCIEAPTVIKHKGYWYLFYAGAYNHERQQIGLAVSKDGRHFERIAPDGLLLPPGEEGSWNAAESGHPGIFRDDDGSVYLFYQGKSSQTAPYRLSVCKVRFK